MQIALISGMVKFNAVCNHVYTCGLYRIPTSVATQLVSVNDIN